MAYRRAALEVVGGFDERFRRAYREDADLAAACAHAGYRLCAGERVVEHPVRPAPWWTSVSAQAGNADDMLMRRIHGRQWRHWPRPAAVRAPPARADDGSGASIALAALCSGHPRRRPVVGIAAGSG